MSAGHLPAARHWIVALSVAVVVVLVILDLDSTSPGPLAPSHAALDELEGARGCEQCHDRESGRLDCSACHGPIEEDIQAGSGLHGLARIASPRECGGCHQEHLQGDLPLVGPLAFQRAGYESIGAYDHAGLDFDMSGRHGRVECVDCHQAAPREVVSSGEQR